MMLIETVKQRNNIKKMLNFIKNERVENIVQWLRKPLVQRILLLIASTLLAMSFGTWFLGSSHTSFAKTLTNPFSFDTSCATVPAHDKMKFCTGADPIQAGCSADAQTVTQEPVLLNGQQVGLAQVRYSPSCNTYWGRGFSSLPNTSVSVIVPVLGTGDTASFLSPSGQAYSNMVYATIPTVVIQVDVSPTQIANTTIAGAQ